MVMEEIRERLRAVIKRLFDVDFEPEVTVAPENMKGDYSTNAAMKLAGMLKAREKADADGVVKAPRDVAALISEALCSDSDFPFDIEVAGPGFLNFISRDEYFKQKLADLRLDFKKNISCDDYLGKTVICEFSDPNPFKVLHVGHLYTSIVGDAISRLVEFAGGKVVRANFGGDVGLHVAKTLYAVMEKGEKTDDIETIAKCYVEGTRAYEDDETAKAKIVEINKEIYKIVEQDIHEGRLAELYWTAREASYKYFDDFYARIGVKFDKYYPESMVAGLGLLKVREGLADGVYEESNGAVVFPGEKYDLHTRVFINAEGLPTYEAKDVGLIFKKWEDYHFDKSVVITGNDIIDYMKVVLKSVSLMAPDLVERTEHITHGNVRLPGNEKMSSRKGNFIRAVDVLERVEEALSRQSNASADARIALSAIKYAFLKYRIGGNIEFDISESVSTTGNSGVYLQYAAVHSKKILEKLTAERSSSLTDALLVSRTSSTAHSGAPVASNTISAESSWVLDEHEKSMIRKMCEYKDVLKLAVRELAPHKVAGYLYELAQEFSRFYENVKVAGSEYESERAEIVAVYLETMTHGLGLLGIEVPEEM